MLCLALINSVPLNRLCDWISDNVNEKLEVTKKRLELQRRI